MTAIVTIGTIHLVNSTGAPVAGGAATAAATTPFFIRRGWSLAAPKPLPIYGGGPPFRPGKARVYQSYDNVQETIPIGVLGSSHEGAVAALQLLKLALSSISATIPAAFGIQPTGSSTIAYAEISSAFVREVTEDGSEFEAWEGIVEVYAEIALIRTPFFGRLSTGETLINAQSISSTNFTGGTDNVVPYSAGSGDVANEGQPLNVTLTNASGATAANANFYVGTIDSVIVDATTQTVTTSSTTGANAASGDTVAVGATLDPVQALKLRLYAKFSSVSLGAQMRIRVFTSNVAPAPFYIGPWFAPQTNDAVYDGGTIPVNLFHDIGLTTLYLLLQVRSSGGSVTITLSNFYLVAFYTLCKISGLDSIPNSTGVIHLRSFVATSGRPCLPLRRAEAYVLNSGAQTYYGRIDGTAPVYVPNSSLFLFANDPTTGQPVGGNFTATVTHAPLWATLRGND